MKIDPNNGHLSWDDYEIYDPETGIRIDEIDVVSADDEDGSLILSIALSEDGKSPRLVQTGPDGEPIRVRVTGIPFKIARQPGH